MGNATIRKTVLIAEDEPSILALLSQSIRDCGFIVETATDGHQALLKLQAKRINLVLLDVRMPGKDGLTVLQTMREKLRSTVPVIILSNLESEAIVEASEDYQVAAYILKANTSMIQVTKLLYDLLGRPPKKRAITVSE